MVRLREFAVVATVAFVAMGSVAILGSPLFHQANHSIALKPFAARPAIAVAHLVPPLAQVADEAPPAFATPATQPATVVQRGSAVVELDIQPQPILAQQPAASASVPQEEPVRVRPTPLLRAKPDTAVAAIVERRAELRVAKADDPPLVTGATAHLANAVALRLRNSVPAELFSYFDVYLYVSKAAVGPWAQHMFIFHKADDNHLVFERSVPVSTGRERHEKYFTSTPTGLFELDPNRFDRNHRSHLWNNAPMPWAMFLDYTIHDRLAGIALHSGIGHVALLGRRASGGCVRLPPRMAQMLFKRFQADEHGMVPRFAFNDTHSRTLTDGTIERGADGQPVMAPGYKVLLIIQNDPGGPALVAELS